MEYRDRKRRKGSSAVSGSPVFPLPCVTAGLTYSRFMEGLKAADIDLDRKVLADLAVSDEKAFDAIFAQAKKAIEAKDGAALRALRRSRARSSTNINRPAPEFISGAVFVYITEMAAAVHGGTGPWFRIFARRCPVHSSFSSAFHLPGEVLCPLVFACTGKGQEFGCLVGLGPCWMPCAV
ncbi:MAG: 50S ribosomal protein L20 [Collinsella sp.]